MVRIAMLAAVLLVSGCASHRHGAAAEVNAVVQDEGARQAAVMTAAKGEGADAALKAGAAAAKPELTTPPS